MIYLVIGFLGAMLMFCGDMLLYYDRNDFDYKPGDGPEAKMQAIINVMKKVSEKRLTAGGIIGPIAAFLYCVGFYHIVDITDESFEILAKAAFLLMCFGITVGGAYHSHCAYLGLLGDDRYKDAQNIVMKYFGKMTPVFYIAEGIGFCLLFVIVVMGKTVLPQWMAVLTPGILFLLKPLVTRLPKGIRVIISGGWSNLISVIYYAAAVIFYIVKLA